jgi:glycosyltransferase involved in cell wall biosynthesis
MNFSIIICTYNSADKLPKTLKSVLSQTNNDFEVVIIDGLSNDGTIEVVKKYEEKFSGNLRWISEKDHGIYDAMNKGIDLSQGDWLYFIGAGDVLAYDDVFQKIASEIENQQCDVLYGNVKRGDSGEVYDGQFSSEKLIEKNISHQAIFYHRNVFEKLGKYDLRYPLLADWEFNMRWMNDENIKSKYIDLIFAKFELGGSSKTTFDKNFYADFEKNIKKYFPVELWKVYEEKKSREIKFVTSEAKWKIWEIKNKLKFAMKNPKKFIAKYMKK